MKNFSDLPVQKSFPKYGQSESQSLLPGDRWKQLLSGETADIVAAPWKERKRSRSVSALYVYINYMFTLNSWVFQFLLLLHLYKAFVFHTLLIHKTPEECRRKAAQEDPGIITEGKCLIFERSESIDSRGVWGVWLLEAVELVVCCRGEPLWMLKWRLSWLDLNQAGGRKHSLKC